MIAVATTINHAELERRSTSWRPTHVGWLMHQPLLFDASILARARRMGIECGVLSAVACSWLWMQHAEMPQPANLYRGQRDTGNWLSAHLRCSVLVDGVCGQHSTHGVAQLIDKRCCEGCLIHAPGHTHTEEARLVQCLPISTHDAPLACIACEPQWNIHHVDVWIKAGQFNLVLRTWANQTFCMDAKQAIKLVCTLPTTHLPLAIHLWAGK
jgi:hypothetical protein